ncbi:hypothetical protein DOM21_13495 [Bacteriovorax stolpii]|uniref:Uncharacterized protein n=1 Tax=Bacteriovorax stolpii TaxID=960 RepID=A0A2K9NR76_BACTC|nr:hypothetical protein [Bacteriovorax stolpii]AUN97585.1 hypothetical protein C0V70_05550 [Bacteriovorax stolpii]QDK42442.1 hypothetical protein DOM21_13495 [Bacteriovorax stolpii]TDP52767.1 hypothetical protein C8D79_2533 [Bacteriovorax stolpii]
MIKTLFILILLLVSTALLADEITIKGEAFDKDKKLIFIETQQVRRSPLGEWNEVLIKYTQTDGKLIAELKADFSKDLYVPETVLIDHRFNEKTEVHFDIHKQNIMIKTTNTKTGSINAKSFKYESTMVSALGLHNFIIKHYDTKEASVKLLIPEKTEAFTFNFEKEKGIIEGHSRFAFTVSSWVLRAILREIMMDYKDSDHTLVQYSGLTDIESDEHNSQNLTIKMSYHGATNDK